MIAVAPCSKNSYLQNQVQNRKKSSISSVFLTEIDESETNVKISNESLSSSNKNCRIEHSKKEKPKNNLHPGIVIGSALALGFTIWYANNQKRELCPAHQHYFDIQKKCLDNICNCPHGRNITVKESLAVRERDPRGCCFQHNSVNCIACEPYFELKETPPIKVTRGNVTLWYGNNQWRPLAESGVWPRSELWNESMRFSDYRKF